MWGVIKRDLAEFVTVVKTDTSEVVKKSVAAEDRDDEADAAAAATAAAKNAPLRALTSDIKTYTEEVAGGDKVAFVAFAKTFDVAAKTEAISQVRPCVLRPLFRPSISRVRLLSPRQYYMCVRMRLLAAPHTRIRSR